MTETAFDRSYLYAALSAQSGLPPAYLDVRCASELVAETTARLETLLVGQSAAIGRLGTVLGARLAARNLGWDAAVASLTYDAESRPLACLLAAGPTGVGKTETARLLAEHFYEGRRITLHGSEVGPEAPHGVATWVGAPPGYVGYNQGGALTDGLRAHRACCILVDEIEKASPEAVQNILLPLMGEGVVTDRNNGDPLWATECIVFATSNITSDLWTRGHMGFRSGQACTRDMDREVLDALSRHLLPEVIGRFNAVLQYRPLSLDERWAVWDRQMEKLLSKCGPESNFELDADGRQWVADRLGDVTTGARGVIDLFTRAIVPLVATAGNHGLITCRGGRLVWANRARENRDLGRR